MARPGAGVAGFPGREGLLCVMDAEANVCLLQALRATLIHWRYRQEPATAAAPAPTQAEAQVTAEPTGDDASGRAGWQPPAGSLARRPVGRAPGP